MTPGELIDNHKMEILSRAYVQAVAGKAGINLSLGKRELDYGIDGTFHPITVSEGSLVEEGFPLDFQLKASTTWKDDSANIIYDMKVKAYNKIVNRNNRNGAVPNILLLLCLPTEPKDWLEISEEQLLLRKCCYWSHLVGEPIDRHPDSSIRVRIPKGQYLSPQSVKMLLDKTEAGRWE